MLGEEVAGEVFKKLDTDDIRLLSRGMAEIPQLEDEQRDDILEEFYDMCVKGDPLLLTNGVYAFLNSLAEKYLDADANKVFPRGPCSGQTSASRARNGGFEKNPRESHAQGTSTTISLIMAYTDSGKSAEVLSQLPVETQVEVCACEWQA